MAKYIKRNHTVDSEGLSNHRVKVLKKREIERKLTRLKHEDYLDDDEMSKYASDPVFYRAMKEYI